MLPIALSPALIRGLLFLLISYALIFFVVACPSASAQNKVERNIIYAEDLPKTCIGDIYEQDSAHPSAPVIIVVHGGSWVTGTKDSVEVMPIIRALWKAGFVVFSVNYRLLSDGGTFPRNVEDVKRAVAYLERSGKNYGADPARIGVVGVSAGAYLALMAAYSPYIPAKFAGHQIHLKACAALCPATDLTKLQLPVLHQYLNDPEEDYLDQLRSASPITYARNAIPTLLEHGTSDRVIPFGQSIDMVKALKSSGVKVRFVKLENSGHDFMIEPGPNKVMCLREIVLFFDKTL